MQFKLSLRFPLHKAGLTFCLACSNLEKERQKQIESLKTTVESFNTAFKNGNLNRLDSLTTENYTHTNSGDRAFSKQSWFSYLSTRKKDIDSGLLKIDQYQMIEQDIQLYKESAIVTGLIISSGYTKGTSFNNQIRVSTYWVVDNGVWKRAGFHDSHTN